MTLIQAEHRKTIEALAEQPVTDPSSQRARILLAYEAGHQTRDVVRAVGLSDGRVRHWRRAYLAKGLAIFPALKEGDPATIEKKGKAKKSEEKKGKKAEGKKSKAKESKRKKSDEKKAKKSKAKEPKRKKAKKSKGKKGNKGKGKGKQKRGKKGKR